MDEPSGVSTRWADTLAEGGCVAPGAEADALLSASSEGVGPIEELIARRLRGEPLAWIIGSVRFSGVRVRVDPGVFVPRPHTQAMARRAVSLLPAAGIAVDLCTGSGAVAAVLGSARPRAAVVATDVDPVAVACARRNGVRALVGNLDEPLSPSLRGRVDVMTAVVPYVPTEELHLLPRDVLANEPRRALDGGRRGTMVLVGAAEAAARWLRAGGSVLLEIGGDQAGEVASTLADVGLSEIRVHRDGDGQDRAIEARRPHTPRQGPLRAAVGGRNYRPIFRAELSISSLPVCLMVDATEKEEAMKYMLLIHQGDAPTPASPEAWATLSQDEQKAVFADYQAINQIPGVTPGLGLDVPETATTVRVQDGKTLTTDGPFVEIKESIGGYLLFEADDLDAAIELAARIPAARLGGAVEVRPIVEW